MRATARLEPVQLSMVRKHECKVHVAAIVINTKNADEAPYFSCSVSEGVDEVPSLVDCDLELFELPSAACGSGDPAPAAFGQGVLKRNREGSYDLTQED